MRYDGRMSQMRTHSGGCHCGEIRFEVELDLTRPAGRCNCTLCTKRNTTGMVVKPDAFRLVAGIADLGEYAWGPRANRFHFCKRCGIAVFGRGDLPELGGAYVSVNVNCIDDIDPATLTLVHWDGRHDNWDAGPRQTPWPVHAGDYERGQRNG